jgi:hypothetical protein
VVVHANIGCCPPGFRSDGIERTCGLSFCAPPRYRPPPFGLGDPASAMQLRKFPPPCIFAKPLRQIPIGWAFGENFGLDVPSLSVEVGRSVVESSRSSA